MKSFKSCCASVVRSMRPFAWRIITICVLGAIQVSLGLCSVILTERVVNIATGTTDADLVKSIIILVIATVLSNVIARYVVYLQGLLSVHFRNYRRMTLFQKVMESYWNGKEVCHSGDTVNRLIEDVNITSSFVSSGIPATFIAGFRFFIATAYLFIRQPQLGWILIFIMPAALLVGKMFTRKMRSMNREIRTSESAVHQHIQESVQHRMLLKSMGDYDYSDGRMQELQKNVFNISLPKLRYQALYSFCIKAGFSAGYLVVFIWSVIAVRNGDVTYGLLVALLQLVSQIQSPVYTLSEQYGTFVSAISSEERLMDIESLSGEPWQPPVMLAGSPGVRVENVTFRYDDSEVDVIEGFSHDFTPGSITAIVGKTGRGKSTLSRLILSLLRPTSGDIWLYDASGSYRSDIGTRCNFMYVPQGNSLLSGSIRDNLRLANPDASDDEMKDALHVADADFVLDLPAGLDSVCAETGGGLSEGQAQRIAIARALLRPGGILVMDEASSSLDSATERRIMERLSERCRGKKTVIFITHREAMLEFADACIEL